MLEYKIRFLLILWNQCIDEFCVTWAVFDYHHWMLITMLHANLFFIFLFHNLNLVDIYINIDYFDIIDIIMIRLFPITTLLKICMNNSWHVLFWISCEYANKECNIYLGLYSVKTCILKVSWLQNSCRMKI